MIKIGDLAKDVVTGYTGAVVAHTVHAHNCDRYALQPRELAEGKPQDALWFDAPQTALIESGVLPVIEIPYSNITLGSKVKDTLTQFEGAVTSLCYWANGCIRVGVQSDTLKDGLPVDEIYVPNTQLTLIESVMGITKATTGGPMKAPSKMKMCKR